MTTPNLAKIERVDLREAWPNEAQDFTPWLARNIDQLSQALDMSLELRQVEAPVGDYSLDVLATDLNEGRPVIIENQLESTNHDHLGKLLTYAAGQDANVIVWLAKEFRDEHRQALDWLNQRTGEDTQFFGVVVELWRIGESPYAPHFKTVATPNDWRKMQVRRAAQSPRDERNYEWRQHLLGSLIRKRGFSFRRTAESKSQWLRIERPIADIRVWFAATWSKGFPGIAVIDRDRTFRSESVFRHLEDHRQDIEAALVESGQGEWVDREGRRSWITIYRDGKVFEELDRWDEFCDWTIAKLDRFREVFGPRLKEFSKQEQTTIE